MEDDLESHLAYFDREDVLEFYARATATVGLWRSEEKVFRRFFGREQRLLDVGCGTGRITLALHEMGYTHLLGVDLSRPMVKRARRLAALLEYPISFQSADATALPFEDALFDGAIFGFNGLMQIPGRERRRQAMREIRRVLRPGGHFVFTAHDRDHFSGRSFWEAEAGRWERGERDPRLWEFGDRLVSAEIGTHYIHVPTNESVVEDLEATGWELVADAMRSEIANEPPEVRLFSDDTRFWVVRRPDAGVPA